MSKGTKFDIWIQNNKSNLYTLPNSKKIKQTLLLSNWKQKYLLKLHCQYNTNGSKEF